MKSGGDGGGASAEDGGAISSSSSSSSSRQVPAGMMESMQAPCCDIIADEQVSD